MQIKRFDRFLTESMSREQMLKLVDLGLWDPVTIAANTNREDINRTIIGWTGPNGQYVMSGSVKSEQYEDEDEYSNIVKYFDQDVKLELSDGSKLDYWFQPGERAMLSIEVFSDTCNGEPKQYGLKQFERAYFEQVNSGDADATSLIEKVLDFVSDVLAGQQWKDAQWYKEEDDYSGFDDFE